MVNHFNEPDHHNEIIQSTWTNLTYTITQCWHRNERAASTPYTHHFQNIQQKRGAGTAQWLERWTHDQKLTGLNPCRSGGRIFFSRVNFPCGLSFQYLLPWYNRNGWLGVKHQLTYPHVTAVAHKRSWSFCQKCRWQVTAKHACTLRMWLCMKWHGACLYGVHNVPRWQQFHVAPAIPAL